MIREDRDVAFWRDVAEHPAVAPHVSLGRASTIEALVNHPLVTPLRSEHGGFLFVRLDAPGRVYDLHTLYTPEGWGREVHGAAKLAFDEMFRRGAQVIVTNEVAGNRRSQPPKTFRFAPCGDFAPSLYGPDFRTWILTRAAWDSSPARLGGR